MMAYDRLPSQRLETETLDALRSVMDSAVRKGDHVDELHDVLLRAAAEARVKGIHAEQLLVILKDLWYSLPELRRVSNTERQAALLQQLISRCIEHYYEA
jgi:transcriptional regulator